MGDIRALGIASQSEFHLGALLSAAADAGGEVLDAGFGGFGEVEGCGVDESDGEDFVSEDGANFFLEGRAEVDAERGGFSGSTSDDLFEGVTGVLLVGLGGGEAQKKGEREVGELHIGGNVCEGNRW